MKTIFYQDATGAAFRDQWSSALHRLRREARGLSHIRIRTAQSGQDAGFTLVELLAAITIMAILMAAIFGVHNQTAKAWQLAERRTEVFQQGRLIMEMITRELENAVAGPVGPGPAAITFLAYENATTIPGSSSSDIAATPPNDQLFFVSSTGDSANDPNGDLSEFGYMVVFARDDHATMRARHYYLLRHYEPPTANNVRNAACDFLTNPTGWPTTSGLGPVNKVPVLDNVVRFEVDYETYYSLTNYGTAWCQTWSTTGPCDIPPGGASCPRPNDFGVSDPLTNLPRAVHIRMSVLDRRTAALAATMWPNDGLPESELAKLPLNPTGLSNQALARILAGNLHTFYRTIHLRNAQFIGY